MLHRHPCQCTRLVDFDFGFALAFASVRILDLAVLELAVFDSAGLVRLVEIVVDFVAVHSCSFAAVALMFALVESLVAAEEEVADVEVAESGGRNVMVVAAAWSFAITMVDFVDERVAAAAVVEAAAEVLVVA